MRQQCRNLYFLELQILEMASSSLVKDTTYLELTTLNDKNKAIDLIHGAALGEIEKEIKLLSDFSKLLSPKAQVIAAERIASSKKLVEKVKMELGNK